MALKRSLVVAACILVFVSQHQARATCFEEEQACKNRCGSGSKYNFDCDDSTDGAAFSCSCTGSGGWVESNTVPLERASSVEPVSGSRCDDERASCETSCPKGTVPEFTCESKRSGSGISLASACACTTPGGSSATDATATTDGGDMVGAPASEWNATTNTTCDEAWSACMNSCPVGFKADFKCDNSSSTTEGSFAIASACACTVEQQQDATNSKVPVATPEEEPAGVGTTSTDGSVFDPSNIQSQNQNIQQATDAGFTMGARYVINYLTVILAAMDHLL